MLVRWFSFVWTCPVSTAPTRIGNVTVPPDHWAAVNAPTIFVVGVN